MSRPFSLFLLGSLCVIASARAVASDPVVTGLIHGPEICPKPLPFCGDKSWFGGKFVGQVGQLPNATGSYLVGVGYVELKDTNPGDITIITEGDWLIAIKQGKRQISGTILPFPASWLTYNGDAEKTFAASVTLALSPPGTGLVCVQGILDHNGWPEVTAMLYQPDPQLNTCPQAPTQ
ncbi:MAG TPA: hypothetical protein VFR66_03870 [Burkholderiales bacterium]|nr:hypothetical protein [Burkholderiales bacterium]